MQDQSFTLALHCSAERDRVGPEPRRARGAPAVGGHRHADRRRALRRARRLHRRLHLSPPHHAAPPQGEEARRRQPGAARQW